MYIPTNFIVGQIIQQGLLDSILKSNILISAVVMFRLAFMRLILIKHGEYHPRPEEGSGLVNASEGVGSFM